MRDYQALEVAAARARAFLDGLPTRPADVHGLRQRLDGPLPDVGDGDADELTRRVTARVQQDGTWAEAGA